MRRIGCASVVGAALVALLGCAAPREAGPGPAPGADNAAAVGGDVAAVERADLAGVFERAGVAGTFVLYDTQDRTSVLVDPGRARERAVPGETFDLVTALVALQTGAVSDAGAVVGAGEAAHRDAVERVGRERLATWVDRFEYGDRDLGGREDDFWVRGPLGVSAVEQTEFLAGLAHGELPVEAVHQEALHAAASVEEGAGYTLYGRAACDGDGDGAPGWWVGWVTDRDRTHAFALRLEAGEGGYGAGDCEALGRELLVALDVLPRESVTR
ncbi:penicillin binding protein transpeptidase domain-containing protein [Nocardiopsis sp. CC223A]|uniref:penicillin binding protein transpeptidase domain-containing protein n=1 Tax=Nocardiopsis sp. CC223A TaxID=3044051 RepID=UPI00278C5FBF|nr:penicillin binding protein transpeptidase domain-containing protein [Nocardiopsis sp. CC223A]